MTTRETTSTLEYDRLDDGTLVATASNGGRSVAAIVHARTPGDAVYGDQRRWCLAGDLLGEPRPEGTAVSGATALAEAAAALGVEMGTAYDSVTVRA